MSRAPVILFHVVRMVIFAGAASMDINQQMGRCNQRQQPRGFCMVILRMPLMNHVMEKIIV